MSSTPMLRRVRTAVTLLEVMLALSLSATMMTSSFVVLRSSFAAWRAHEADLDRASQATALLRHLVRHVRQSAEVTAISGAGDLSGSLTVVRADGSLLTWEHSGTSVGISLDGGPAQPLSDDIKALEFHPLRAGGQAVATEPLDVRNVRIVVTSAMPAGGDRTISSNVWLRSW